MKTKKLLVFLVMMSVMIGMMSFALALDTATKLSTTGNAISEVSNTKVYSAPNSAHLRADKITNYPPSNEGRVRIEFTNGMTLGGISSISWMQYVVEGYISHVDVLIDTNADNEADDALVFEWDKVTNKGPTPSTVDDMTYRRDSWVNAFDDRGIVNNDAYGWLNSGAPGAVGSPGFYSHTLAEWKAGPNPSAANNKAISSTTKVTAIEIEVDGWIVGSEAYIDDIMINGEIVEDFETNQKLEGGVEDFISFVVSPEILSFGNIPYGIDITKAGSGVTIDTAGSSTVNENIQVEVEVSQDTGTFFKTLLEFDTDGAGLWTNVPTTLIVPSDNSKGFSTRLKGNTAQFGAGPKSGVLTYTATSIPPGP